MTNPNPAGYPSNPNPSANPNPNMGPNPAMNGANNFYAPQPVAQAPDKYGYLGPERFRPLSPWSYFGWAIVYSIPVVGLIFMIVHAVSDTNINRRNFARSYLCYLVVALIVLIIVLAATGGAALSTLSSLSGMSTSA